jgi:hypothetical protein
MFRNEAGTPDAREMQVEHHLGKTKKRVETLCVRGENKGGVPFVILNQILPSRFLRIISPADGPPLL